MSQRNPKAPGSGTSLNVIALISGGKDSLYSILHCIRNGHKVVALANLHPPLPSTTTNNNNDASHTTEKERGEAEDDIDSFMYQTIGWNVIPLYEAALGIPLYRQPIEGDAVDSGRVYGDVDVDATTSQDKDNSAVSGTGPEDETESLIPLLQRIKSTHPEANAVCAGAILSTYQRTRIEDVAGRLGLTPLAWLWQYPFLPASAERRSLGGADSEAGLLEDMAAAGCRARIVKVASGALDEGFLWGDVADPQGGIRGKIVRGVKKFSFGGGEDIRGAVIGEGGEYETLAVDGPGFLWRGRIEVPESGREVRVGDGGVGYLRLTGARVVAKGNSEDGVNPDNVRRPAILDGEFTGALSGLQNGDVDVDRSEDEAVRGEGKSSWTSTESIQAVNGGVWTVSNITAPEAGPGAAEQMAAIVTKIRNVLDTPIQGAASPSALPSASPRTTSDIIFTTVLLRSMADFPSMNGVYLSLFQKPNPPARATVACGESLPDGVNVMVSMVVDLGSKAQRDGLHVQSRSYWAPANIGPYSQAMSVPLRGSERMVYIAGQIPLEPASMELIESESSTDSGRPSWDETYCLRAVLSLQHMWRIGAVMEVGWWLGTVAFFTGTDHVRSRARLAWKLWRKMHTPIEEALAEEEDEDSTLDVWDIKYGRRGHEQSQPQTSTRPQLPNFDLVEAESPVPTFFAVQVHELPKGSDIEWQGLGYRCMAVRLTNSESKFGRTVEATTKEGLRYTAIEIDSGADRDLQSQMQHVLEVYGSQPAASHVVIYTSQPQAIPHDTRQAQIVPCKSVWGPEGRRLAAGVVIQRQT